MHYIMGHRLSVRSVSYLGVFCILCSAFANLFNVSVLGQNTYFLLKADQFVCINCRKRERERERETFDCDKIYVIPPTDRSRLGSFQ